MCPSSVYFIIIVFYIVVLAQQCASASSNSLESSFYPNNMVEEVNNDMELTYSDELDAEPVYYGRVKTDNYDDTDVDRNNEKRSSRIHIIRRGCIRRNGACDHRPNDCCFNSSCRCNFWGNNCRCQRMGLFQKWG